MRQYIYRINNGKKEKTGILVAFRAGEKLYFGCAFLCNSDREKISAYNRCVKLANQESYRIHFENGGKPGEKPEGIENLKPLFDKAYSFDLATSTASSTVVLSSLPPSIRKFHFTEVMTFIGESIARLGGEIKITN